MDVFGRRQTTVPMPPSRFPFPAVRQAFQTQTRDEALMTDKRSLVSIVDDDESVRESLPDLLRLFGFAAEAFSSAEAFLASDVVGGTSCLLLDIAMPGMSGPDLQQELTRRRQKIPIVFITGLADGSVRPRLLARGAAECLFKPFSEAALLDAVEAALRRPYSGPVTAK
jgi:FixJ family two-component response regulator